MSLEIWANLCRRPILVVSFWIMERKTFQNTDRLGLQQLIFKRFEKDPQFTSCCLIYKLYLQVNYTFPGTTEVLSLSGIKAMYNSIPLHSRPLSVNLANNALLRHLYGNSSKSISVANHPLPQSRTARFQEVSTNEFFSPDAFFYALCLTVGVSFFVAAFVIFPLTERITNAKQVQLMTGVSPAIFWGSNLAWDISLLLISTLLTTICLVALDDKEAFTSHGALGKFLKYW